MNIDTERKQNWLFVKPDKDRIDGTNAHDFHVSLEAAIADTDTTVIVDLGNMVYISSAGLRAMLLCAKSMGKRDGKLMLCSLKPPIKRVLQMSGFDKIMAVHDSRDQALASLEQDDPDY